MGEKALLIICLTVLGAAGLLGLIYAGARRGAIAGQIDMARRIFKNSRNPWKAEDEQLSELSKKVEELNKPE